MKITPKGPKAYQKFSKKIGPMLVLACFTLASGASTAFAATTPSLGTVSTYAVLSSTYTNTTVTTITGGIGFTTGPATTPLGVHINYGSGTPYATAGIDQGNTLTSLASQACTFTFAPGPINLSTDITHGALSVYVPGVYCSTGAMRVAGPLTLSGSGTYIFRPIGALTSTVGSVITLTGASACDVFWTPSAATTLAANTTFIGTLIDASGITVGANTTWTGMALAFGGTVTTDTDTITVPTCTSPLPVATSTGGAFSTPSIRVSKVPTPLSLPTGPGMVTYNYKVSNGSDISLTNVNVNDDTCSPVVYLSGDNINPNEKLDPSEVWDYNCTMLISTTTTNIVTATGVGDNADHFPTLARATATVLVSIPVLQVLPPVPVVTSVTPPVVITTNTTPTFPNTGLPPETKNP
jgi:hypothetical protein